MTQVFEIVETSRRKCFVGKDKMTQGQASARGVQGADRVRQGRSLEGTIAT